MHSIDSTRRTPHQPRAPINPCINMGHSLLDRERPSLCQLMARWALEWLRAQSVFQEDVESLLAGGEQPPRRAPPEFVHKYLEAMACLDALQAQLEPDKAVSREIVARAKLALQVLGERRQRVFLLIRKTKDYAEDES